MATEEQERSESPAFRDGTDGIRTTDDLFPHMTQALLQNPRTRCNAEAHPETAGKIIVAEIARPREVAGMDGRRQACGDPFLDDGGYVQRIGG